MECKQDVLWRWHWTVEANETVLKLGGGSLRHFTAPSLNT
jgi:hypothetical protein